MSIIIPAILPTSREDLERTVNELTGLVQEVQIDIVDGRFASPASWPYKKTDPFIEGDSLPKLGEMHYEMDLMVSDPGHDTGLWIAAGAERITLHAESTQSIGKVISELEVRYGHAKDFAPNLLSLGLAYNISTELAFIEPFLPHVDYVQFMGISQIGRQGEPFDERVLRKISAFKRKYPEMIIQVDGGVSLRTAPQLMSAGVDRLIVGSALWKSDNIKETIEQLQELSHEYGIYS